MFKRVMVGPEFTSPSKNSMPNLPFEKLTIMYGARSIRLCEATQASAPGKPVEGFAEKLQLS